MKKHNGLRKQQACGLIFGQDNLNRFFFLHYKFIILAKFAFLQVNLVNVTYKYINLSTDLE
jgi:hypothetical protein